MNRMPPIAFDRAIVHCTRHWLARAVFCGAVIAAIFLPFRAAAETPNPFQQWTIGKTWALEAVYLKLDGLWSKPKRWHFSVTQTQDQRVAVQVQPAVGDRSKAWLEFDLGSGFLARIRIDDIFRAETVSRRLRIEQPSPVYPLLSAIPYFFPHFRQDGEEFPYQLKRVLNDRSIGTETLEQHVIPIDWKKMIANLSKEDADKIGAEPSSEPGSLVRVIKNGKIIFQQYWFGAFPWAVYTVTDKCKVWLK